MRAARLLAITLRLQRTGFRTAQQLAEELEVSVRTIYRDVEALQAAGVPVWTVVGDGGGIHIDQGWRSPVDGLTAAQIAALLVGEQRAEGAGLGPALRTARASVVGRSPAGVADLLVWFDQRFVVDPVPWFQPPPSPDSPDALATVAGALRRDRRLELWHRLGDDRRRRRVDPLGLVQKHGVHYLVAAHRRRPRTYRVSRIEAARVLDEPAIVPEGFDLASYWSDLVDAFEAQLRPTTTRLRLRVEDRHQLRRAIPGRATEQALAAAVVENGSLTVDLTVEELPVAAQQLAAVASLEVLAPEGLRRALVDHCSSLARRHERAATRLR